MSGCGVARMSEDDLQELIRQWYHGHASRKAERLLTPTPGCPPLPVLWRHHAQGEALGEHEPHVAACERCHRLGDIIAAKLHSSASASRSKYINRWVAGLVACAACVGLVFFLSDDLGGDDALIAQAEIFWEHTLAGDLDAVRGDAAAGEAAAEPPEWIIRALADGELRQAIDDLDQLDDQLLLPIWEEKIRIEDQRLVLSGELDSRSAEGQMLQDRLRRYDSACDQMVAILIRHLPNASENNRKELRRALDRWRAKEVFAAESGG